MKNLEFMKELISRMDSQQLAHILTNTQCGNCWNMDCNLLGNHDIATCRANVQRWLELPCIEETQIMRYICRKPPSFSYGDINQGRYKRRCGISSDKREVIIMTNRDKINRMSNTELADILNETDKYNACKYCYHNHKDCVGKACVEGIERWLNTPCVNEPKNPPADKHVDLQKVADEVTHDNVNHPSHYNHGKIEVIDFIEDQHLGFNLGNAVKYISRAGRKDPARTIEDLRKAAWYLNRQIERLEMSLGGQNA